jgi:tRNA(fMet)-specific endonuclease VapC
MGSLIDSSVLIAAERGALDFEALLAGSAELNVAISAVTASELLHGVHRASRTRFKPRREAFVEQLLRFWPILPFDVVAARVHARIWSDLTAKGIAIGAHDLMIGATALANGYSLATCDKRSFSKIPGLEVLQW